MKQLLFILSIFGFYFSSFAQKNKSPYKCGFYDRDSAQVRKTYETNLKYWEVQKGETVASIGPANGNLEVRCSIFIDSINWTLEEIDSSCLNKIEFDKVLNYYQTLSNKKIIGNFNLVIGNETGTNLPANTYDRALLINVYHELTKQKEIIAEVYKILKNNGKLVIMEKMANRKGKKRGDCNHIMPYEPDFMKLLLEQKFELVSRTDVHSLTYFIFKKVVS